MTVPYHVGFLKDELARRQSKTSRYSLRAFAHHLEIHPSALSRILANKQDVSLRTCVLMMKVIDIGDPDKIKFLCSISEEKMHRAAEFLAHACDIVLPISRADQHWPAASTGTVA
jgi:hypothetical protein